MDFKTATAAFVVAHSPTLDLPRAVGLTDAVPLGDDRVGYGIHDPSIPAFVGQWPAVGRTWCRVDPVGDRQLVQLYFSLNDFLELWSEDEDVPLEDDDLKPLVDAFVAAAERLDAEIGWIDARAHHGHEDWENRLGSVALNIEWARLYLDQGRDAILDEHFQLTWMRQDVTTDWGPDFERAFETTDAGWLLWHGDESSRWF